MNKKLSQEFHLVTLNGYGKQKTDSWFPIQPRKNLWTYLEQARLLEQKTDTGVSVAMKSLGVNWIVVSHFTPKKYAFLTASRSEVQNSKFGQKLNSGFQFREGLMKNLNLALHCFALHHCIVFHSINLLATTFNASHPMPSEALPCPPLHCTPYWCSLYPQITLPYLFVLTSYSTSYLLHPWKI